MNERDLIDPLIDRVAHDMTDADPSGDFRVRVIASLPTARPRQAWWQYLALAGGGVGLGILLTALLGPIGSVGPKGPQGPGPVTLGRAGSVSPVGSSDRAATPVSAGQPIRRGPAGQIGPTGPAEPIGEEFFFPRLSISPIQPLELSIAPLVVGPIAVSPIDSRPGGRQK